MGIYIILKVFTFMIGGVPNSAFDLNLLINPFNIYFVIWIISVICFNYPMQKVRTIQDQNSNRKKFYFKPFFLVIFVWFILFSGFSLVFNVMSSHPNPIGGCDICGSDASFKYEVNDVVVYRYCEFHAVDKAFLDPRSVIDLLVDRYSIRDYVNYGGGLILWGALMNFYTWVFVIGFALILGSGYTWEKNWERNFLKSIEYKIKKLYFDFKTTIKEFFEIYRNE
jgi:hypothetical protein